MPSPTWSDSEDRCSRSSSPGRHRAVTRRPDRVVEVAGRPWCRLSRRQEQPDQQRPGQRGRRGAERGQVHGAEERVGGRRPDTGEGAGRPRWQPAAVQRGGGTVDGGERGSDRLVDAGPAPRGGQRVERGSEVGTVSGRQDGADDRHAERGADLPDRVVHPRPGGGLRPRYRVHDDVGGRSEEHTSELQSRVDLVCRLLREKKKKMGYRATYRNKKNKRKHK